MPNNFIEMRTNEINELSRKTNFTNEDYEEIHSIAWDIQIICERNLRRSK